MNLQEDIKLPSLQAFLIFFKKIKNLDDTGSNHPKSYLSKNIDFFLRSYAAQIDSIISSAIKDQNSNHPEINYIAYQLAYKHFKLLVAGDLALARKLINTLSKSLFSELKSNISNKINFFFFFFKINFFSIFNLLNIQDNT
jgi:hypothetical protein